MNFPLHEFLHESLQKRQNNLSIYILKVYDGMNIDISKYLFTFAIEIVLNTYGKKNIYLKYTLLATNAYKANNYIRDCVSIKDSSHKDGR